MEDGQVYDNLVEATRSLDALLADVKANPRRYVNVSVFGKKEPTETSRVKDSLVLPLYLSMPARSSPRYAGLRP